MTRHEVSQLAIGSKVIVETGIYKGVIGSIKAVNLSAAFPNGALLIATEKHGDIRCSGVEVNRASSEREVSKTAVIEDGKIVHKADGQTVDDLIPLAEDEEEFDYVEADGPDSEEIGEELED